MDGDGVMADAWFSSIKAAAFAKVRYKAVHQIKTGHRLFPIKIKDDLKDAPAGIWIVLQSTYQDNPIIAIGYHYSTCTSICFVATKAQQIKVNHIK
jgi:hypothetical protein